MNSEEQKNYFSGVFSRAADSFDTVGTPVFARYGKLLVEQLDVPQDAQVLDIACGRGSTMIPMLDRLSDEGSVVGIDLAEGMVRNVQETLNRDGYRNASVCLMDAENIEFDDRRFDIVVCGFGIFFFPDINRAMGEITRVSKDRAILAISTFSDPSDDQRRIGELDKKYRGLISNPSENENNEKNQKKGPDFSSPNGLVEFLEYYGFGDIVTVENIHKQFFETKEQWLLSMWTHGKRGFFERLQESGRLADYADEAFDIIDDYTDGKRVANEWRVLLTTATLSR